MAGTFQLEWADLSDGPGDSTVKSPTPGDLDAILGVLAESASGFVILSAGDELYIQAAAPDDPGGPLIVEHRAGDADRHFEIDEPVFDAARLSALFRAFLRDPGAIGSAAKWRRISV